MSAPVLRDVFGEAVTGYWQGDRATPLIVRREDGHIDRSSPGMWVEQNLWPAEAAVLHRLHGHVLDVGCGAGRHLLALASRGFRVTGIDRSPLAVSLCRERGAEDVIEGDVMEVALPEKNFDTAILFGNNIGIGGTPGGVIRLLARLRRAVRGNLVMISIDVTRTRRRKHLKYQQENRAAGRSPGAMVMRLEYGDSTGQWFSWLHPGPVELQVLAAAAGWSVAWMQETDNGPYAAVLTPADD